MRRVLPECELWNLYGVDGGRGGRDGASGAGGDVGEVPIGRPLDNVTVALGDAAGEPVALGAIGEIVVAGARRLSPGYSATPRADKIVLATAGYRTGDLGRWRRDGTLEHHGRGDRQVKIRGVRADPMSSSTHSRPSPQSATAAAAVVTAGPDGSGRRVRFYTTTGPSDLP